MSQPKILSAPNYLKKYPDVEKLLDQVVAVEQAAWPPSLQAPRDKFVSRLEIFPEGFIVATNQNMLVGVSTSEIITYPYTATTWDGLTDNGYIKHSHNPTGNALYIVSVGVSPQAQGQGVGGLLVAAQKQLATEKNHRYALLGARMPGYQNHCATKGEITAEQYALLQNAQGEPLDPELRFYSRHGFQITKVLPNFETDPDSHDYGVVMVYNTQP